MSSTKITFYYVFQSGKSQEQCPICGVGWKLNGEEAFIDYKCDPCRLVADEV